MATKNAIKISMEKGKDELRFEPFKMKNGTIVASLRVFYQDRTSEDWKPGKQGLTLKKSEFPEFVKNMKKIHDLLPDDEE